MSIPLEGIDENEPAGGDNISLGDNAIRRFKTQNRQILEVDHIYPSSGQSAYAGKHKKISLLEQADIGTGVEGKPILGAQTVSGKAELLFTDEDNNDVQLTSGGKLHAATNGLSAGLKEAIFNFVYPIGKVITLGVNTNPNTLFGFGTWTQIKGRVIVGIDDSGTFSTLNATMGAETVATANHAHRIPFSNEGGNFWFNSSSPFGDSGTMTINRSGFSDGNSGTKSTPLSSSTGGETLNIVQPTVVKYCWERTS